MCRKGSPGETQHNRAGRSRARRWPDREKRAPATLTPAPRDDAVSVATGDERRDRRWTTQKATKNSPMVMMAPLLLGAHRSKSSSICFAAFRISSREPMRETAPAKAEARNPKESLESRLRCALIVGLTMVKKVCTGRPSMD